VFERFTDRARRVLVLSQEEARLLNHSFIGTEHFLLGLLHEGEGIGAKVLAEAGVTLEAVREKVEETIGSSGTSPVPNPPYTPRSKRILELALREALSLGNNWIGTEHLLLGLIREGEGVAAQVLVSLGVDLATLRGSVLRLMKDIPPPVPPREPLQQPTPDEIRRVRAWEHARKGHTLKPQHRMGNLLPTLYVCDDCGQGFDLVAHTPASEGPKSP
jgi:ATP-dependent Clp protease ATP-binding subunit ClpC